MGRQCGTVRESQFNTEVLDLSHGHQMLWVSEQSPFSHLIFFFHLENRHNKMPRRAILRVERDKAHSAK